MNETQPFLLDPSLFHYLQRAEHDPFSTAQSGEFTAAPPSFRRQTPVDGIGLRTQAPDDPEASNKSSRPLEGLLLGPFEGNVPFSFQVSATPPPARFLLPL